MRATASFVLGATQHSYVLGVRWLVRVSSRSLRRRRCWRGDGSYGVRSDRYYEHVTRVRSAIPSTCPHISTIAFPIPVGQPAGPISPGLAGAITITTTPPPNFPLPLSPPSCRPPSRTHASGLTVFRSLRSAFRRVSVRNCSSLAAARASSSRSCVKYPLFRNGGEQTHREAFMCGVSCPVRAAGTGTKVGYGSGQSPGAPAVRAITPATQHNGGFKSPRAHLLIVADPVLALPLAGGSPL